MFVCLDSDYCEDCCVNGYVGFMVVDFVVVVIVGSKSISVEVF